MQLDARLAQGAAEISLRGSQANIPDIELLFQVARNEWAWNSNSSPAEQRWRLASLIYGAHLGLHGDWTSAVGVYGEPFAHVPADDCVVYAGLMAIGQAVALWHLGDSNAGWAAMDGSDQLAQVDQEQYVRWQGIGALIMCITEPHTVNKAAMGASALRMLDETLQPSAYALARFVSSKPGCYRTFLEITEDGLGTIPASEGLYLFKNQ